MYFCLIITPNLMAKDLVLAGFSGYNLSLHIPKMINFSGLSLKSQIGVWIRNSEK
jgi:hypothetical protein